MSCIGRGTRHLGIGSRGSRAGMVWRSRTKLPTPSDPTVTVAGRIKLIFDGKSESYGGPQSAVSMGIEKRLILRMARGNLDRCTGVSVSVHGVPQLASASQIVGQFRVDPETNPDRARRLSAKLGRLGLDGFLPNSGRRNGRGTQLIAEPGKATSSAARRLGVGQPPGRRSPLAHGLLNRTDPHVGNPQSRPSSADRS